MENYQYYHTEIKERLISYASHYDSIVLSYYSFLLSKKYEELLRLKNLDKNILAYRKVLFEKDGKIGKNTIHFARDIFREIHIMKDSITFAFDINHFFDTLNHKYLKKQLCLVLGIGNLSEDWYSIFKNITKYSYIEKDAIAECNLEEYDRKKIDTLKFHEMRTFYKENGKQLVVKN